MSFWPRVSMGAMKTTAKSSALPRSSMAALALFCATKVAWVRAEAVASILAPLTTMPPSVSFTTRTKTSPTSWAMRCRSTGGFTRQWLRNSTLLAYSRYQRAALASKGA